jgi:hypothetical protein
MKFALALTQRDEHSEWLVAAPPIHMKVAIKREDIASPKFVCQMNQAGICEVDFAISIFREDLLHSFRSQRELHGNLKNPGCNVCQNSFGRARKTAQQVATLNHNGFTGHKRVFSGFHEFSADVVMLLRAIEQGNHDAGVNKDGFQRPNPRI